MFDLFDPLSIDTWILWLSDTEKKTENVLENYGIKQTPRTKCLTVSFWILPPGVLNKQSWGSRCAHEGLVSAQASEAEALNAVRSAVSVCVNALCLESLQQWSRIFSPSMGWSACSWVSPSPCGSHSCWSSSSYLRCSACPLVYGGSTWIHCWKYLRWVFMSVKCLGKINPQSYHRSSSGLICSFSIYLAEHFMEIQLFTLFLAVIIFSVGHTEDGERSEGEEPAALQTVQQRWEYYHCLCIMSMNQSHRLNFIWTTCFTIWGQSVTQSDLELCDPYFHCTKIEALILSHHKTKSQQWSVL